MGLIHGATLGTGKRQLRLGVGIFIGGLVLGFVKEGNDAELAEGVAAKD